MQFRQCELCQRQMAKLTKYSGKVEERTKNEQIFKLAK
jgi:hypothetical protein